MTECDTDKSDKIITRALAFTPPARLICSICQEIFYEPMIISCFHSFCKSCLHSWMKNKEDCPLCRSNITSCQKNILLTELLDEQLVHCRYAIKEVNNTVRFIIHGSIDPRGCKHFDRMKYILEHESKCPYQTPVQSNPDLSNTKLIEQMKAEKLEMENSFKKAQEDRIFLFRKNQKLRDKYDILQEQNRMYKEDLENMEEEVGRCRREKADRKKLEKTINELERGIQKGMERERKKRGELMRLEEDMAREVDEFERGIQILGEKIRGKDGEIEKLKEENRKLRNVEGKFNQEGQGESKGKKRKNGTEVVGQEKSEIGEKPEEKKWKKSRRTGVAKGVQKSEKSPEQEGGVNTVRRSSRIKKIEGSEN